MSYIFVGGIKRSGANILYKLLCDSKDTNDLIPVDASYIQGFLKSYGEDKEAFEKSGLNYYFTDLDAFRLFNASHLQLFLNQTKAQFPTATHLVLKDLTFTKDADVIQELAPTSKFIFSVRDPRDLISAMISTGETLQAQGEKHFSQERKIGQMCRRILNHYKPLLTSQNQAIKNRALIVRYEDLKGDLDNQKKVLEKFCELKFANQLQYEQLFADDQDNEMNKNYQDVLSAEEIEKTENLLGSFMKTCGYLPK